MAAATATTGSPPTLRLLFTGDINPGRCPAQIALAHDDFTLPYQRMAEALRGADLAIGSLDGALSDLSAPAACPQSMNLIGPSRSVEGLAFAGFDVITVATNHAKDCGRLGWDCDDRSFLDTLRNLAAAGILPVGGGGTLDEALRPVMLERQGVRFAFIGVLAVGLETWATAERPGTAPLSDETLASVTRAVADARAQADVVVVLPHWGVEYSETPTDDQRRWAAALIDAGATLVVGNHAHLAQPVEAFATAGGQPRGLAAYALGNFVFDQGPWRTRQGLVLEAVFAGRAFVAWNLLPIHIYSLHQPDWAEPEEARAILERVQAAATAMGP